MKALLVAAACVLSGCTHMGEVIDQVDDAAIKATAQRQDVADRLLRYHVTHVCMGNYDSLRRVLNREQLGAVRTLCSSEGFNEGILIPEDADPE